MQGFLPGTALQLYLSHPTCLWSDVLLTVFYPQSTPDHAPVLILLKKTIQSYQLSVPTTLLSPPSLVIIIAATSRGKKQDLWKYVWLLYNPLHVCKTSTEPSSDRELQGIRCLLLSPGAASHQPCTSHKQGSSQGPAQLHGWITSPRWHSHYFDARICSQIQLTFL